LLFVFDNRFQLEILTREKFVVKSFFERLGEKDGISAIIHDTIANHEKNQEVRTRFQDIDVAQFHRLVVEYFGMGSGGPQQYSGKDIREAQKK
jgi:hemoglobin